MARLSAYIDGVGAVGPGFDDWTALSAILAGSPSWQVTPTAIPAATALPPAERRRCGAIVKLSLAVGLQTAAAAGLEAAALPTVFAASGGDGTNCHEICQQLATDDRLISPTRFHNSVHNAAAGYWSIATGATAPSSVLCAFDGSFGAGLLEALAQVACEQTPVLLIAADTGYPEPLRSVRPIPHEMGVGLVLAPRRGPSTLAHIDIELSDEQATAMSDPRLEGLRRSIPVARALPMLALLGPGKAGRAVLDYLDDTRLAVTLEAC